MNKIVPIGLIIFMAIQCFYKLGVISYYQFNQEYIAEVLCVNKERPLSMCEGQCFLEKNLTIDDGPRDIPGPVNKEKDVLAVFLISSSVDVDDELSADADPGSYYNTVYLSEFRSNPFRPPCLG